MNNLEYEEYKTKAVPKAFADEIPVFCTHDEILAIEKVLPNPANPNIHPEEQIKLLAYVICSQGWRTPITISNLSGFVVRGHGRLMAAQMNGSKAVPVEYQSYATAAEEYADMIADNRLGELSEIDNVKLVEIFNSTLVDADIPMILSGYTPAEYSNILADLSKAELMMELVDDVIPTIEYPTITQEGDLWLMGNHKLVCGDSTKAETYDLLLNGELVKLCVTDPPYNVNYETAAGRIENDNLSNNEFSQFLEKSFLRMAENAEKGAAAYVFHSDTEGENFRKAFCKAGFLLKQCLIWQKSQFVLGRQDYQWQHEPILYGWREGAAHYFRNSRRESTILNGKEEIKDFSKMSKLEMLDFIIKHMPTNIPGTLLLEGKPLHSELHPTMKPTSLLGKLIENSSVIGWSVLDPFGGSGSTLIACDLLGRKSRLIELEPSYCDVIVRRYMQTSGKKDIKCIRKGRELENSEIEGIFISIFES